MKQIMKQNKFKSKEKITKVGVTKDTLTGRGGLALFVRYLSSINIYALLFNHFSDIRKSMKGKPVWNIFKQIFCFFYDGTSRHLVYFDQLRKDEGYAAVIENSPEEMLSSHQVKRFFRVFSWIAGGVFRKILKRLFIWRLKIERPKTINLTLDTMGMNNNEAKKRHGVEPTYKKYLGFQPLQIIWNRKIVDAIFRGGKKHSNYGNTAVNMVTALVKLIRKEYDPNVTIILRIDSGFFDEVNLEAFNKLNIGFICTGKIYEKAKEYIKGLPEDGWETYDNGHQQWDYIEFGYRYDSWKKFYRALYTKPVYEDSQRLLEFARPDNIIITNIGVNPKVMENLSAEKQEETIKAKGIINSHHQRGADELPHRGIKDFGFEELPFKRFAANSAFYYCMVISFFLFETFKEDVLEEVIPIASYATTVRRKALDFAAKIVKTGRGTILRVTQTVMDTLRFKDIWKRCQNPIPIVV
ncbi:MAG: IS1380 family transposase [Gammaproteobacteria bacterium]|nr:IS1380 family transposase [Gammaproteobacteria bacterium]